MRLKMDTSVVRRRRAEGDNRVWGLRGRGREWRRKQRRRNFCLNMTSKLETEEKDDHSVQLTDNEETNKGGLKSLNHRRSVWFVYILRMTDRVSPIESNLTATNNIQGPVQWQPDRNKKAGVRSVGQMLCKRSLERTANRKTSGEWKQTNLRRRNMHHGGSSKCFPV